MEIQCRKRGQSLLGVVKKLIFGAVISGGLGAGAQNRDVILVDAAKGLRWKAQETALILIDLWDNHYCRSTLKRTKALAVRVDPVVRRARQRGVQIIHAPADTMKFYAQHPARQRTVKTPLIQLPMGADKEWYFRLPGEPELPIAEGCDSGEPADLPIVWTRQETRIHIDRRDHISDRIQEIYSVLRQGGRKNVLLAGVHSNYCILSRPWGARNLKRLGFHVAILRDLTDPYIDTRQITVAEAQRRLFQHVEKYIVPTVTQDFLTKTR